MRMVYFVRRRSIIALVLCWAAHCVLDRHTRIQTRMRFRSHGLAHASGACGQASDALFRPRLVPLNGRSPAGIAALQIRRAVVQRAPCATGILAATCLSLCASFE